MMRFYGPGYGWGFHPFAGLFGGLLTMLMLVAIVVLVVRLIRGRPLHYGYHMPSAAADPLADARALAARRFAAGEITKEQYEEISATLLGRPAPGPTPPSDAPTVPLG